MLAPTWRGAAERGVALGGYAGLEQRGRGLGHKRRPSRAHNPQANLGVRRRHALMNPRIALTLLGLLTTAASLRAQTVGPSPDSAARAYYAVHRDEYAAERRALAATGGRVSRTGGVLRLRLASGRTVTLGDTLQEGGSHYRAVYVGFRPGLGLHVIEQRFYEGGTYAVYHDRTGREATLPGPPVASPDGRRFLSASLDLEAGYDPNRLEIWRVEAAGLHCEAVIDGEDRWGPDSVAWIGPDAVQFARVALEQRTLDRRSTRERIVRSGTGWALQSSPSRRLTNRCS